MARSSNRSPNKDRPYREQDAEAQRAARRRNRHHGDVADYANVGPSALHNAVTAVTSANCAIQFGYTKDGSAFVVRIVGDGEPYNEFIRPSEDMDAYLGALAADYTKQD